MTTAPSTLPTARLTCHAPHKDPKRARAGAACEQLLGDYPGGYEFITIAKRLPTERSGDAWIPCPKCKAWNRFRIVPIETPATVTVAAPDATLEQRLQLLPPMQQRAALALATGLAKAATARMLKLDRGTVITWSKRPDFAELVQAIAAVNTARQASVTEEHLAAALSGFFEILEKDRRDGRATNYRWLLARTVFRDVEQAKAAAGGSQVSVNVLQQQQQTQASITSIFEKRRAALSDVSAVAQPKRAADA